MLNVNAMTNLGKENFAKLNKGFVPSFDDLNLSRAVNFKDIINYAEGSVPTAPAPKNITPTLGHGPLDWLHDPKLTEASRRFWKGLQKSDSRGKLRQATPPGVDWTKLRNMENE